jgi:two-component system invasion response regulator UvrY
MKEISILIADDHKLVRETWGFILGKDTRFVVVAETASGEDAVEMTKKLHPDIVIMDITLPGINGIEATQLILESVPGTKVLGVSLHSEPAYVVKMMKAGAMGYITKNSPKEELFQSIIEIQNGRKYICKEVKDILADQMISSEEKPVGLDSLSERELEIIDLIRSGNTSREIAEQLQISTNTVEVHRHRVLKKLKLKNSVALVNFLKKH